MDNIKITKIEDSEAITITEEEFDNKVKQCMCDLAKIQEEKNISNPLIALIHSMAYAALNRKLFKMDIIRITKIEDSEAITITEEEFDNKVKQCMCDLAKIQEEKNISNPLIELIHSMAYASLSSKLFKED